MKICNYLFYSVLSLLCVASKGGSCQNYAFITKTNIKTHNILSIYLKLKTCNNLPLDTCAKEYLFENGLLKYERIKENSLERKNEYNYISSSVVVKDIEDIGQAKRSIRYTFDNGKLISSVEVEAYYFGGGTSEFEYGEFIRYKYDSQNQLENYISFDTDNRGNPKTFISNKYMIYNKKEIVGYFPLRNESDELKDIADTIYYKNKVQELHKIGFNAFRKKYFTTEVYKKVIEDCYEPVRNDELLINGRPIKEFLSKIGKSDLEYVSFEIFDNQFLFYKLID